MSWLGSSGVLVRVSGCLDVCHASSRASTGSLLRFHSGFCSLTATEASLSLILHPSINPRPSPPTSSRMTPLNLAELGLIAEHLWLHADLDRYDENSPTQLFVHCPFDKPHPVSDALLKVDCSRAVVGVSCAPCKFEIEYSCTEVAQGLREASVDYVTNGRAAYVGVADLLEGAERPRSRSAPLYLVGVDDLHISESMLRELYGVPYTVVMSEDDLHQRAAVIRGVLDISECLAGTVRQLMDFLVGCGSVGCRVVRGVSGLCFGAVERWSLFVAVVG